jgi:hypothetical protein
MAVFRLFIFGSPVGDKTFHYFGLLSSWMEGIYLLESKGHLWDLGENPLLIFM